MRKVISLSLSLSLGLLVFFNCIIAQNIIPQNTNYYYASGNAIYWQDDSTSVNIIVANINHYDSIVQNLQNIFNDMTDEIIFDNEDDNIIVNSIKLPQYNKDSLIAQISVSSNDISFFTYSKLIDSNHLWLRNDIYIQLMDTTYFSSDIYPLLVNDSIISYEYEGDNEYRITCSNEWSMMLLANYLHNMNFVNYSTPDFYSKITLSTDDVFSLTNGV